MNKSQIYLAIATALALVSCGGGGGGGSSSDSATAATNDGTKNYMKYHYENAIVLTDTKTEASAEYVVNGDTIRDTRSNPNKWQEFQDVSYVVNGEPVSQARIDRGEFNHTVFDLWIPLSSYNVYNGKNGPSAYYNQRPHDSDNLKHGNLVTVANSDRATSYNDVYYAYSVSNSDGSWTQYFGDDGKIAFDPSTSKWGASLGGDKVILDGKLDGITVSGTAKYENLTGTFEGSDVYYKSNDSADKVSPTYHYAAGGYAGSNGTKTFAGVWGQTDNPIIKQHDSPIQYLKNP